MEGSKHNSNGLAAPLIFVVILCLHILSQFLSHLTKKRMTDPDEAKLVQEIKLLLKEANSLSTPSTFANAAKLRRAAATKEKELIQVRQNLLKEKSWASQWQLMVLRILKVCIYLGFVWWFWGIPVAAVSTQLLQPFGNVLSWRVGVPENGFIMIGIIPWLFLTTRVSAFISHKLILKKAATVRRM
eukprot:Gb_29509 [translate_table: standard]